MEYRVNVSSINLFQECPTKWFYEAALHRAPRARSAALGIGTLVHKDLEEAATGSGPRPIEERYQEAVTANEMDWDPQVLRTCESLTKWLAHYYATAAPSPDGVLYAEAVLETTIDRIHGTKVVLAGRLDLLESYAGRLWHRQYKTRSNSGSQAVYSATKQVSLHEAAYALLVSDAYPDQPYGGTILVTIIKASAEKRQNGKSGPLVPRNPDECVHVEHLPLRQEYLDAALSDIRQTVADQLTVLARFGSNGSDLPLQDYSGRPFAPVGVSRNRAACAGHFGNSLCPFFRTCWGDVPITDETFYQDRNPMESYETHDTEEEWKSQEHPA